MIFLSKRANLQILLQKLIKKLQECKHCIATFALLILFIMPHNVQSVCNNNVDLDDNIIVGVRFLHFHRAPPMPSINLNGVNYASPRVSDGLFNSAYRTCTSSDGNSYYLVVPSQFANACPDDTTLISLSSASASPKPIHAWKAVGAVAFNAGCRTDRIFIAVDDSNTMYNRNAGTNGPSATENWSTSGWSSTFAGLPLCKLDYQ